MQDKVMYALAGAAGLVVLVFLVRVLCGALEEWMERVVNREIRDNNSWIRNSLQQNTEYIARVDRECCEGGGELERDDERIRARLDELQAKLAKVEEVVNTNALAHNKMGEVVEALRETSEHLTRRIQEHEQHGTGVKACNKRIDELDAKVKAQALREQKLEELDRAINGSMWVNGLKPRLDTVEQNINNLDRARVEMLKQIDVAAKDVGAAVRAEVDNAAMRAASVLGPKLIEEAIAKATAPKRSTRKRS